MKHGHIETLKIRLKSTFFVIFTLSFFKVLICLSRVSKKSYSSRHPFFHHTCCIVIYCDNSITYFVFFWAFTLWWENNTTTKNSNTNIFNINISSDAIASDYDAYRAAQKISEELGNLQRMQALAVGA